MRCLLRQIQTCCMLCMAFFALCMVQHTSALCNAAALVHSSICYLLDMCLPLRSGVYTLRSSLHEMVFKDLVGAKTLPKIAAAGLQL